MRHPQVKALDRGHGRRWRVAVLDPHAASRERLVSTAAQVGVGAAQRVGVMAFLVKPVRMKQIVPTLALAVRLRSRAMDTRSRMVDVPDTS